MEEAYDTLIGIRNIARVFGESSAIAPTPSNAEEGFEVMTISGASNVSETPRGAFAPSCLLAILLALGATAFAAAPAVDVIPPLDERAEGPSSWVGDLTPIGEEDWSYARARHLLNRAGFGGTPEEIAILAAMTPRQAVAHLLHYETIPNDHLPGFVPSNIWYRGYPGRESAVVTALAETRRTGSSMGLRAGGADVPLDMQEIVNESYYVYFADRAESARVAQWWAERMLRTRRPLEEKLAFFWHGHFATANNKAYRHDLMRQQIETLREHASGSFRDLLIAVSQDPQMLIWLDNRSNTAEHPNENYAREIMELFCLGIGNYTEQDIRELARALTGWTLSQPGLDGHLEGKTLLEAAQFYDDPTLHDRGDKTILGKTGNFDGYGAIDVILAHEATPRFLTAKLYRFFVREELSSELHESLARRFRDSGLELQPLLEMLFLSRDFYSPASFATRLKSPVELVVSTYRQLGLEGVPGVPDFRTTTLALGQELLFPPNVAGWNGGRAWINPATLFDRGNFAHDVLFPEGAPPPAEFFAFPVIPGAPNREGKSLEQLHAELNAFFAARKQAYVAGTPTPSAGGDEPAMAAGGGMAEGGMAAAMSQRDSRYQAERYSLALGVRAAMTKLNAVVLPIERTPAELSLSAMLREEGASSVGEAVDHLVRRLLMLPLPEEGRVALVVWAQSELGGDTLDYESSELETVLRRIAHVIMSAPEFQLA